MGGALVPMNRLFASIVIAASALAALVEPSARAAILGGGDFHSAVVHPDHTVWGWGAGMFGQLGNGTRGSRYSVVGPVRASGLRDIVAIAVGGNHTLALDAHGVVWSWGDNLFGELGDGTREGRASPVRVVALDHVEAIAAGYLHSVALRSDGSVWVWGNGLHGQLGIGNRGDQLTPVRLTSLVSVRAIAAGFHHTIAIDRSGAVWTWGQNSHAQLGDGTRTDRDRPVRVNGLTNVTAASGGQFHTLALLADGTVMSWGANLFGQLGYPTGGGLAPSSYAATAASIMAGGSATDAHIFDKLAGTPQSQDLKQLANGTAADRERPTIVPGLPRVGQVSAGEDFSLALAVDHTVWGWGDNLYGELGDGTWENRVAPVRAQVPGEVTEIAAGYSHAMAVRADGSLFTWGFGAYGQLGSGRAERRLAKPTLVDGLSLRPMVYDAAFEPYSGVQWLAPLGRWANGHLFIRGVAPSAYGYAAAFTPVKAGPGTGLREFVAEGDVKVGGITIGLQVNQQWVYYRNIALPGPFLVRWEPLAAADYAVVIAHYVEQKDHATDVEFTHMGWFRGAAASVSK